MKPVLFLSHSSKDNELVARIKALIEKDGACKTVLDVHDLQQGQAWRAQLYQWMACCQAGLVLLTEAGIGSDWVLQEATILRARKALEPGFKVFLVVPPEVKTKLPERWRLFEPLQLDEIQGMQSLDAEVIGGHVGKAVAAMVAANRPTLFERLAGILGDLLSDLLAKPDTVRQLSDKLGIEDAEWHRVTGGPDTVIDLVARRLCRGDLGKYANLRAVLEAVQPVSTRDLRENLLYALAAYWVSPAASAMIPAAAEQPPPRLLALRAVDHDYLLARYIERQYRPYRKTPIRISLSQGNESRTELRAQLLRQLKAAHDIDDPEAIADDEFLAWLATQEDDRGVAGEEPEARIIVLLPEIRNEQLALDLAREFSMLVFIITVKDAGELRGQWTRCRWIEPELPRPEEVNRLLEFGSARKLID
jgi:TIR domain-containing protein